MAVGKLLGVRVDPNTLEKFQSICDANRTSASEEVRRFIEAVVEAGKLPQTDEEMVPADALDERIQKAVAERVKEISPSVDSTDNIDVRFEELEERLGIALAEIRLRLDELEERHLDEMEDLRGKFAARSKAGSIELLLHPHPTQLLHQNGNRNPNWSQN